MQQCGGCGMQRVQWLLNVNRWALRRCKIPMIAYNDLSIDPSPSLPQACSPLEAGARICTAAIAASALLVSSFHVQRDRQRCADTRNEGDPHLHARQGPINSD